MLTTASFFTLVLVFVLVVLALVASYARYGRARRRGTTNRN